MKSNKVALVTGANRGLGFESCRQLAKKGYTVILTSRDSKSGEDKAGELRKENLDVIFHKLNVDDAASIQETIQWVEKQFGRLDVLINNAAVLVDRAASQTEKTTLIKSFETNVVGPYLLCEFAGKLMLKNKFGRIVNVSSEWGQLHSMVNGYAAYRISKAALNAVTKIMASQYKGQNILVNSVCPGWVKTDMGGANAELTPEEGVDTIVWAAMLPDGSPTGRFFQKRTEIPW